eukprot:SAG22_NODE_5922_length_930_cov_1.593261_2_plen_117_part_00
MPAESLARALSLEPGTDTTILTYAYISPLSHKLPGLLRLWTFSEHTQNNLAHKNSGWGLPADAVPHPLFINPDHAGLFHRLPRAMATPAAGDPYGYYGALKCAAFPEDLPAGFYDR